MTSDEIRSKFLEFFKSKGHAIIPSASLVPENDPSVLFNTAGMQPLVPYLLGAKHPAGKRIVDIQKCVRTGDIDEVGDATHLTFFEMMGNWSLGDYFKKDAIEWSYELLTSKEKGFGLDPQRLYVTCFEGDENAPKDEESAAIWDSIFKKNGITGERIYFMPTKNNWWSAGDNGPCGPDTEMFYDLTGTLTKGLTKAEYLKADEEQKVVEIWNDVFMEYKKKDGKVVGKLDTQNVDTGSGLERVTVMLQGKTNVYETDLFQPIIKKIQELAAVQDVRAERIIADHIRAATFLIAEGVTPSNTDQGYVLRRLLRRAIRYADILRMRYGNENEVDGLFSIAEVVINKYKSVYENLETEKATIKAEILKEETKFRKTLKDGLKQFEKGTDPFTLATSYGFPIEVIQELATEKGVKIDMGEFNKKMEEHQNLSRTGSEKKFKGGLGGTGEVETRYHTATHLLNAALREVLGKDIMQKGSNITAERMRFDFSYPEKMTDEQKQKVESIVNEKIKAALPVTWKEMPKEEAEKTGAVHAFGDKYSDIVKVYTVGDEKTGIYSREFCGGPHVINTSEIGTFKIVKEEAVSAGVRRIKAVIS